MNDSSNGPMGQLAAHLDRGWDLVAKGDFAGATLSAEKTLELDEGSPEAHNLLGYIYHAEGRAEDALEHYEKALDLDESFVDAMLNAAEVMVHPLRDYDGALRMVREAREWLSRSDAMDELADAMLLEVDILLLRGDETSAKSVVRDLPAGPFDNPRLMVSVGRARLDVGDVEGAMPLVEAACQVDPPIADAFYYLAVALEKQEDFTGALIAFLQARELDAVIPPPPWSLPRKHFESRVQTALSKLPAEISQIIEGALVIVTELPGTEVVAEGLDPRVPLLLDALSRPGEAPYVGRIFVYKKNIERMAPGVFELDAEIARTLISEVQATFPADGSTDTSEREAEDASDVEGTP